MDNFTPTEKSIMKVLSDGGKHSDRELRQCLPDDMAEPAALRQHIFNIRRKLRDQGHLIVCDVRREVNVKIEVDYQLRRRTATYDE